MSIKKKNWTGERLETYIHSETATEHLHRYAVALEYVKDKVVLDIASGEGYGSNLMAEKAQAVIGVDIDQQSIVNAIHKYKRTNLSFLEGTADAIPLQSGTIDIVVSFETIEHHDKHNEMMKEILRVLKPDGLLIMSSPDKKTYSDETGYNNPFHIKELYEHEFKKLINKYFKYNFYYGQRFLSGSLIELRGSENGINFYAGSYLEIKKTTFTPIYNIVLASNVNFDAQATSFYVADLSKREAEIRKELQEKYENTTTWKMGRALLRPFNYIQELFK